MPLLKRKHEDLTLCLPRLDFFERPQRFAIFNEHSIKSLQKCKKKFFGCGHFHKSKFRTNKSRWVFLTQDFCKLGKLSRLVHCQ